ncbi:MAG: hypothetical protein J6T23_06905 [Elusimicrobia bacterium]|nr:hypothetical protein [Elusimicrobiota bacterium]
MILIITHKTDFTVDFVINKLNKQKIKYKRFNCEDILKNDCSLNFNNAYSYSILGETKYQSVWFRRTKLPEISNLRKEEKIYVLNETDYLIKNMISSLPVKKWLSHPNYVYRAENKLLQLQEALKIGFKIPATLVTNSHEELKKFIKTYNNNIIVKPFSYSKIDYCEGTKFLFTNKVPFNIISNIDSYDLTPCIYQQNITKKYEIRVTVVNNKVFAAAIYSQKDKDTKNDWRRKNLQFYKIDLPKTIEFKCISLVKKLNLKFGAIDLIKTKKGEYIFLEINPNGQWAWIEAQTGLQISDAIIKYLI